MTDTLIIGYGSIGKRHARVLGPLVGAVRLVTSQTVEGFETHANLAAALALRMPDYIVLCSPTHLHGAQLAELAKLGFKGTALVEKPLVAHVKELAANYPFTVLVGYNLRFHPVVQALKARLAGEKILSVSAYVGQHLSQWRPGRDIRETYSAHRDQGGGVLRDLSHEIDLLAHLFGALELVAANIARVGNVTVDSEDSVTLMLRSTNCSMMTLEMNYLDLMPTRMIRIITDKHSITADLIKGEVSVDGVAEKITFESDDSYRAMHQAALAGEHKNICSFAEGLRVVQLIERAEA